MTDKQQFWIKDHDGVYGLVEGVEARNWFTQVKGWVLADEPGPENQVHVHNEHPDITPGRLPYGAIPGWAGLGWSAGPPPGGPATAEEPAPAVEPVKPTKAAAPAVGEQKEK